MGLISGFFKYSALLVLLLAVALGAVNQIDPNLFFRVPHIGYLFYAIMGNPMPPFYDFSIWEPEAAKTWLADGDVVCAIGAKCGTNWIMTAVHQIRTQGDPHPGDINCIMPWAEFKHTPGMPYEKQFEVMRTGSLPDGTALRDLWDNPKYPFHAYKSHAAPLNAPGTPKGNVDVIPVLALPKVRFLAVSRNGKDTVKSLFHFWNEEITEFREIWGGFPPSFSTPEAVLDFVTGLDRGIYFGYTRGWWNHRHEKNVLLLHYSDAQKDRRKVFGRIADFVGVKVDDANWPAIMKHTSADWMRNNPQAYMYYLWANPEFMAGRFKNFTFHKSSKNIFVRKAKDGDSAGFFTAEMDKKWNKAEMEEFPDPELRRWAREGGGDF
eukprot:TRINITY_DN416_c0_g2_i2.p1 TRINITY_DN416_c0_g2~~TRINITY_DN416_c0_g2_i2.p1  ORF type:complete len:379 (+),score=93.45 TRINITY_DN416_c0_g2_i2:76-1212(+)